MVICCFFDIVLFVCMLFECNDIDVYGFYSNCGILVMYKLVELMYEVWIDFEIFKGLCECFGKVEEYCCGMNEMEWVECFYCDCCNVNCGKFEMFLFEEFWKIGYVFFLEGKFWVCYVDFCEDFELYVFGMLLGFIEIYS